MIDRRALLLAQLGAATAMAWPAHASANGSGARDFDFLVGAWRVGHRYLRRGPAGMEWREVEGTCANRTLAGGWGDVEAFATPGADGAVNEAVGLRAYDPSTGLWAIWWLDGRAPSGPMDPPMKGRFDNGVGVFFGETTIDGKSVRVRFIWSAIASGAPRWEQAYSRDGGQSWETNWIMAFRRAACDPPIVAPAADAGGVRDFDFLVGDWVVRHRRQAPGAAGWVTFDGTCRNLALMSGRANMEEHLLHAPKGDYRAFGLRSFDPSTGQWAIRWLDQRYPSGPIDPPVRGRFEGGVGRFYSDYEADGKAMRVRYLWSEITPGSARWEQAVSADAGASWAPNWVMRFRRLR